MESPLHLGIRVDTPASILTLRRFGNIVSAGRRAHLQRLFSAFPSAWPGMGLLLLRAGVGLTVIVHSAAYFGGAQLLTASTWTVAVCRLTSGACLLIGFLTPLAGVVVGMGSIGSVSGLVPGPAQGGLYGNLVLLDGIVVVVAVALLGRERFHWTPGCSVAGRSLFLARRIRRSCEPTTIG